MSNNSETHTSSVDINDIKIDVNPEINNKKKKEKKRRTTKKTTTDSNPRDGYSQRFGRMGGKKSRGKKRSYTKKR